MSNFEKVIFNEEGRIKIPDESGTLHSPSPEELQKINQNKNKREEEEEEEEKKKNYQPGDIVEEQGRKMVVGKDFVLRPATSEDLKRAAQKNTAEKEKLSENQ